MPRHSPCALYSLIACSLFENYMSLSLLYILPFTEKLSFCRCLVFKVHLCVHKNTFYPSISIERKKLFLVEMRRVRSLLRKSHLLDDPKLRFRYPSAQHSLIKQFSELFYLTVRAFQEFDSLGLYGYLYFVLIFLFKVLLVEMRRVELLTPCLQGRCSPNWATPPHIY